MFTERELRVLNDALYQAILRDEDSLEMGWLPENERDAIIIELTNFEWVQDKVTALINTL